MDFKGIIFDMDGVLCDSEHFILMAAIETFKKKGLAVQPEDFTPFIGAGDNRYLGGVAEKYNFPYEIDSLKAEVYETYCEIIKGQLKPIKGVYEFVTKAKEKGYKLAVASSADLIKVKANLNEINLPFSYFNAIINGLMVKRNKPNPDIFLLAAEKIGLDIKDCLVCEDAINGIEAARRAGAKCLGITSSFTEKELKADMHFSCLGDAINIL